MDMSTNMIAVLGTGSMLNAQTSDSIAGLPGSGGLDFQSMLMGMLGDTGSPVSEAFNANNLLTSILMAQTDNQGETEKSEPTETPFLEASEISRLLQGLAPMQSMTEPVKTDTGENADTADVGLKVVPEVQSAEPNRQALVVRAEANQSFAVEERTVNEINNLSDLQDALQSRVELPTTEKAANSAESIPAEPIPAEQTERVTNPQTSEFNTKLADKAEIKETSQVMPQEKVQQTKQTENPEAVTRPSGAEKETLANTKESAFERPENNLERNSERVVNEIKVDGNERVVPAKTQTEQKTDTTNTNSEDVSAKHFANVLQNSEVREAAQTSATEKSTSTQQSRPAYVQVASGVETAMSEGKEEFTMQLSPEGLGEISVKLMREGSKVTISIAAENPETHSLLLGSVDSLVKNLSLSHVNVESVQIQQSADAGREAPAPVTSTESYDFGGQGADVNREGAQRENHGSHKPNTANRLFAEAFDDRPDDKNGVNETLEMLRTQMRVMDYLA